jgi:hypothetical protein
LASPKGICPADNAPEIQRNDHQKPEQHQQGRRIAQIVKRDERRRMGDDHLGFFQRDDREEQADTGRHRELQVVRDRVDDVLADAQDRDQKEDHARAEHRGQRLLPGVFVGEHHGEGEKRIEPHAGRQRDRVIGVEAHHQRRDRRRNAGRDEHRAGVHAGLAQDRRVDEHDVDHREKRRQPGDEFDADTGALLLQAKITVEHAFETRYFGFAGHRYPPRFPD